MQSTSERAGASEAGFTLVEALIATVVLAFGLIAVTNLLVVAATSNAVANRATTATASAMEEMERLKAVPFGTLATGGNLDVPQPGFSRTVTTDPEGRLLNMQLRNTWVVTALPAPFTGRFIAVRSEEISSIGRQRTRAEFTTFRSQW